MQLDQLKLSYVMGIGGMLWKLLKQWTPWYLCASRGLTSCKNEQLLIFNLVWKLLEFFTLGKSHQMILVKWALGQWPSMPKMIRRHLRLVERQMWQKCNLSIFVMLVFFSVILHLTQSSRSLGITWSTMLGLSINTKKNTII